MIKLVQRQPEYRFETAMWNGDLADDRPLDECGWHVRRYIKRIIERWRIQPQPERDEKGAVKRDYDNPYWNAWRDMFMRNSFQVNDIEVLFEHVNSALLDLAAEKQAAIEELEKMPQEDNPGALIASPRKCIRLLEETIEQITEDQNYIAVRLHELLEQIDKGHVMHEQGK